MILASLKPYYYYLIGERKKNIEVRKSALKDLPQDIVFYMSKDEKSFAKIPKEFQEKYRKHFGKVGIKAVVDKIGQMKMTIDDFGNLILLSSIAMWNFNHCLSNDELDSYLGDKTGYGWHLDNAVISDKPKKLSEFYKAGAKSLKELEDELCSYCYATDYGEHAEVVTPNGYYACEGRFCEEAYTEYLEQNFALTRPPQSYMYVKELKEV